MFPLTIIVIISVFTLDITLSILNYKNRHQTIPPEVQDVYNPEDYKKWLNYTMEGFRLSIISKIFNTSLLILFLFLGIFKKIADLSEQLVDHKILQILVFFAIYGIITYILGIGFSLYRTFHLEEKYGFNKTTVKTFVLDQIKSTILSVLLGGGLLYLILSLYDKLGTNALIYLWVIIIGLTLIINLVFGKLIIRIFNKVTPLPEGELYDKSKALANSLGYEIKKISVMDASKRSTRLNAFFTGFGKFKSIILYDTLIEKCDTDQIVSVLAHEIGHAIHKDTLKNFLIGIIQMGLYLSLLTFFMTSDAFSIAFGFDSIHLGFTLILFGILLEPAGILINIPLSALSRKAEYKADAVAAKAGYKDAMIQALKVLAKENFANLTPHPLVVKMTYSHPPVAERIKALNQN